MRLTPVQTMVIILLITLGTMITRFTPFLLFPEHKKPPKVIEQLGNLLPAAMMGLLVVYCLRGVDVTKGSHGIPEFLAIGCILLLHRWKDNVLLSIGGRLVQRYQPYFFLRVLSVGLLLM